MLEGNNGQMSEFVAKEIAEEVLMATVREIVERADAPELDELGTLAAAVSSGEGLESMIQFSEDMACGSGCDHATCMLYALVNALLRDQKSRIISEGGSTSR